MVTFYDLVIKHWSARFMGRTMPCAVGRGGIGEKRGEGDGITPRGTFEVLEVFSRHARGITVGTPIRLRDIWSDDPKDPAYNTPGQRPSNYSHERIFQADGLYDLVMDIDFNRRPPVAGKGSAIFLHVWRKPRHPTEGCVAFAKSDLVFIAENWTTRSRVIIR